MRRFPRLSLLVAFIASLLVFDLTGHAQTADDLVAQGRAFFAARDITNANTSFAAALALSPGHPTANVFRAATRLMVIANTPAGSALLDRLGFAAGGRNIFAWQSSMPHDSNGTPIPPANTSADVLSAFLRTNVLTELLAAEANLANVVDTNFTLTLTSAETGTVSVTLDYGDLHVVDSSLKLLRYWIYTVYSWNLDSQLTDVRTLFTGAATFEGFLNAHPGLFTFATTGDLSVAGMTFSNAVSNYNKGSDFIRQRPSGTVRLFNLSDDELASEEKFRQTLGDLAQSLNGPVVLTVKTNVSVDLGNQVAGIAPPRAMFPEVLGNSFVAGTLPDPTFGGVAQGIPRHRAESFLANPKKLGSARLPAIPFLSQFQVPSHLPDGTFQISLDAVDGSFFIIETSSDLQNWSQVGYGKVGNGVLSFRDRSANGGNKYYRAHDISSDLTINGTIFDITTGHPISNAVVVVYLPDFGLSITNITDNNGNYLIVSPIHDYFTEVIVTAQGFGDFDYWFNANDPHPVLPIYLAPPGYTPDNDDFANARTLTGAVATDSGANIGASYQTDEPFYSGYGETVWWKWTAPADGAVLLDTVGSSINTSLTVYTGNILSNLSFIATDFQFNPNHQTRLNFFVTQGTTYRIQVDSADGIPGKIVLNLQPTVPLPPHITSQPRSQVLFPFDDVWLSVAATGTLPLTFQWQKDGSPIPTATDPYLEILPIDINDAGTYQVVVSNRAGFVFSSNAIITVSAPQITGQPRSQTVAFGEDAYFFVNSRGAETYQWRKNGVDIPLENYSVLYIPAVTVGDQATYSVVLSNAVGTITSSNAVLSVSAPQILQQPRSQTVAPGTEVFLDVEAVGVEAYQWRKDGIDIPAATDFQIYIPAADVTDSGTYSVVLSNAVGTVTSSNAVLAVVVPPPPVNDNFTNRIQLLGTNITAMGTNGYATLETDEPDSGVPGGASVWWTWTAPFDGAVTLDTSNSTFDTVLAVYTGNSLSNLVPIGFNDDGAFDVTSSLDFFVTAGQAYQISVDGYYGGQGDIQLHLKYSTPRPPLIYSVTPSQSVFLGDTIELDVYADGTRPLSYQWLQNGTSIPSATTESYLANVLTTNDTGPYTAIVTNRAGSATSDPVFFKIYTVAPPNDNFSNRITIVGLTNTLSGDNVGATREAGEPYHAGIFGDRSVWWTWTATTNGIVHINTSGSSFNTTLAVYTGNVISNLAVVATNDNSGGVTSAVSFQGNAGTTYQIAVDGAYGDRGDITLYVAQTPSAGFAPQISTQPQSQTVSVGGTAVFTVNPTGTTPLYYQWRKNSAPVSNATNSNYQISNAQASDAATYSVVITNLFGSVTSSNATLTVNSGGPVNDLFANRITLTGANITATGSNIGATKEIGEPNHAGYPGGKSVWWTWTASSAGQCTIDTFGSGFDTLLAVYTGSSVSALTTIASNDDSGGATSRVTFSVSQGVTYQIAVDGYGGASGSIVLHLNAPTSPANDMFINRILINGPTNSVNGSNSGATKELGEPNHANNVGGASVWWSWQAPANANVSITTVGSTFDTTLAVYTGTIVSNLTTIAYNDDIGSGVTTSSVSFLAGAGTVYQIAVDGFGGAQGNIVLNVQQAPAPPQITTQPASKVVVTGSQFTVTVGATGTAMSYAWSHNQIPLSNGGNIQGANAATLTILSASPADTGTYTVAVTNALASASAMAAIIVASTNATPPDARHIVVLQRGDGVEALAATGNSLFLVEYGTAGNVVTAYAVPNSGANALIQAGNTPTEGWLTKAGNGQSLVFAGYARPLAGAPTLANSSGATVNRGVGTYDRFGIYTLAAFGTNHSTGNIRSATGDGLGNFWTAGSKDGIEAYLSGAPNGNGNGLQIWNQVGNNRVVNNCNGNLYLSTTTVFKQDGSDPASGADGVYAFTGFPTTFQASPATNGWGIKIPTNQVDVGIYDFAISPDGRIAYITDDQGFPAPDVGGIHRFDYSGGQWNYSYRVGQASRGITVDWSHANPVIFATTPVGNSTNGNNFVNPGNDLVKIIDTGAGATITTIATAAGGAFAGVRMAPGVPQTIIIPAITKTYGDADFDPGATSDSALPVIDYYVVSGPASIVNGLVHLTGTGSVTIRAAQVGNATYSPAVAYATFVVGP